MADETAEILQVHEAWQDALEARDESKLDALLWDGLLYQHASGRVQTKAEYVKDALERGRRTGLTNIDVRRFGDTGILSCLQPATPGPANVDVLILFVWAKQDGRWRMAARQAMQPRPLT